MEHVEDCWALWHPNYGFNFSTLGQSYEEVWSNTTALWRMTEPGACRLGYLVLPCELRTKNPVPTTV